MVYSTQNYKLVYIPTSIPWHTQSSKDPPSQPPMHTSGPARHSRQRLSRQRSAPKATCRWTTYLMKDGQDSGTDLLERSTIHKAYFSGLCRYTHIRQFPSEVLPEVIKTSRPCSGYNNHRKQNIDVKWPSLSCARETTSTWAT